MYKVDKNWFYLPKKTKKKIILERQKMTEKNIENRSCGKCCVYLRVYLPNRAIIHQLAWQFLWLSCLDCPVWFVHDFHPTTRNMRKEDASVFLPSFLMFFFFLWNYWFTKNVSICKQNDGKQNDKNKTSSSSPPPPPSPQIAATAAATTTTTKMLSNLHNAKLYNLSFWIA